MKKLAILFGIAIVLATAVVLWAQNQPNQTYPSSPILARIHYHGDCNCSINDRIEFIWTDTGKHYRYAVRCGATEDSVLTENLQQGNYYITFILPTFGGCDSTVAVQTWHSGFGTQIVNLDVYP